MGNKASASGQWQNPFHYHQTNPERSRGTTENFLTGITGNDWIILCMLLLPYTDLAKADLCTNSGSGSYHRCFAASVNSNFQANLMPVHAMKAATEKPFSLNSDLVSYKFRERVNDLEIGLHFEGNLLIATST